MVQYHNICILTGQSMIFNVMIAVVIKLRWIQMQSLFALCASFFTAVVWICHECLLCGDGRKWHCLAYENKQPFILVLVMRISIVSDERFSLFNMLPFFVLTFPAFSSSMEGAHSAKVRLEYLCNYHFFPPSCDLPLGQALSVQLSTSVKAQA